MHAKSLKIWEGVKNGKTQNGLGCSCILLFQVLPMLGDDGFSHVKQSVQITTVILHFTMCKNMLDQALWEYSLWKVLSVIYGML